MVKKCGKDSDKMREVIRSSKCKVPWSNLEIEEADRRAHDDLEHYQLQFKETGGDEEEGESDRSSDIEEESMSI